MSGQQTSAGDPQAASEVGWVPFWFRDSRESASLRPIRVGLAIAALAYFVSHWSDIGWWFGSGGILSTDRLSRFLLASNLEGEGFWRWSPLFWVGSASGLRLYLVSGAALAVLSASSITRQCPAWLESRIPSLLLWLWVVWLANRSLLVAGPEEMVLAAGLAYLAISPPDDTPGWPRALARRLFQLHVSGLIALTGLTMLASTVWWDGTGVVAVAAPAGRRWWDLSEVVSIPWVHEPLTHAIVALAILAPPALWCSSTARVAWVLLLVWCGTLAALSGNLLYFAVLGIMLLSFRFPNR